MTEKRIYFGSASEKKQKTTVESWKSWFLLGKSFLKFFEHEAHYSIIQAALQYF